MIPQFSQLFIYSPGKSNSVCKIFISAPSLDMEQNLGRLFGIIEIETADRALWDTANNLAEGLETNYYGGDDLQITPGKPSREVSVEETFEKAIQGFNDKLIELIKGGKLANLLDKINIIIGVFKDRDVYFSTVGNTSAFLIHQLKSQEYRIINILDASGGQENKINPFKILSNIVNGQIDRNDSLLFCTNSLLDYLSLDKIKQTVTTLEPAAATRHLKDLLLEASINTTFASIVFKLAAGESEARDSLEIRLPQKSLDHLVITERTTEQYLSPPLKFNLIKYSSLAVNKTKKLAANAYLRSASYLEQRKQRNKPHRIIPKPEPAIKEIEELELEKETPAVTRRPEYPRAVRQPIINTSLILPFLKKALSFLGRALKALGRGLVSIVKTIFYLISSQGNSRREKLEEVYNNFINWLAKYLKGFKSLPHQSQILLIACLILFILFASSIGIMGQSQSAKQANSTFNNITSQIEQKNNDIESALIYNNEDRAQQLYAEAKLLYAQLTPQNRTQRETIASLGQKLDATVLKLQHINKINPAVLADLNGLAEPNTQFSALSLNLVGQKIYVANDTNNSFYSVNLTDKKASSLNLASTDPKIKFSFNYGSDIIYYHGGNGLIKLNTKNNLLEPVTIDLSGKENAITAISAYNNRLYVLSAANNQIYRYNTATGGFGQATNWLKDGEDIKNATAMIVDGDAYILDNIGKIQKFTAGRAQTFNLGIIEPAIGQPNKIWTDPKTKNLYVLDAANHRLVVIEKSTGKLSAQYTSDSFGQLKDMVIVEKDKKAYLLSGNVIYQVDLN